MRRIPRPLWAIDPSAPLHSAIAPCTHLRTPTAAFSSTASNAFLLPAAKQDKKKHQQFVRKWQKRLLGDSEPIGAHVDPYDPTSPVRIAPEEQGEYEEVLEDDNATRAGDSQDPGRTTYEYVPAQGAEGGELMHIGGKRWLEQKVEGDRAKEFEKLTLRTYTPLTLDMADEIEELTGTPYTLRDDNLMMAQTVHEITSRPYTSYQFGLQRKSKLKNAEQLSHCFAQAVAEVYTLKDAGAKLDLASSPNRGIYNVPPWVKDIKLCRTEDGKFALAYPKHKSAEQFLHAMQMVPELEAEPVEEEHLLVEEAADLLEPVLPSEPAPTMDPATPAFKRAAIVKQDPEKKPFDFMSNRPVPRAKLVKSEKVVENVEVDTPVVEPTAPAPSRLAELASAFETSQTAVNGLRHTVMELRAQRIANEVTVLRSATRSGKGSSSAASGEEVKWRHVPLTDNDLKFALFKRVYQLTGIRVSDPHLSSSQTLGDLYDHVCAAAKPQATSLYNTIISEGHKARERANRQARDGKPSRQRADLGDLIKLGNVELRRRRPDRTEIRRKTGMQKVYQRALSERGLQPNALDKDMSAKIKNRVGVVEGTRKVPSFGKALSSKGAAYLADQTRKRRERDEEEQRTIG